MLSTLLETHHNARVGVQVQVVYDPLRRDPHYPYHVRVRGDNEQGWWLISSAMQQEGLRATADAMSARATPWPWPNLRPWDN